MVVMAYRNLKNELLATVFGGQGVQNGWELLSVELDCIKSSSAAVSCVFHVATVALELGSSFVWRAVGLGGKRFSRTIDDGTDDLVDLAILSSVGAGESLAQSRSEGRLEGLERALKSSWAAECRSSQRPGDAAIESRRVRSWTRMASIVSGGQSRHTS